MGIRHRCALKLSRGTRGEQRVMEHGFVSLSWIHRGPQLTCPCQAGSWAEGIERKLWFSRFLKWRVLREAGFTEQRSSPALGSGRITSRFHMDPSWLAQ
ncbi:hypothetical protein Gogos_016077 [Gossypium gossypioides]|uniref:Uncharacterized protein n=1 Tax=Gossypium gossypioides TaxID=34282 RepID=A0A7J9B8B7_GOSGO|nr:hypothetical protein [Gossypium gossypioides]